MFSTARPMKKNHANVSLGDVRSEKARSLRRKARTYLATLPLTFHVVLFLFMCFVFPSRFPPSAFVVPPLSNVNVLW